MSTLSPATLLVGATAIASLVSACSTLTKPGWTEVAPPDPCGGGDGDVELQILVQDEERAPLPGVAVIYMSVDVPEQLVASVQRTDANGRLTLRVETRLNYVFTASFFGFAPEVTTFQAVRTCPRDLIVTLEALSNDEMFRAFRGDERL